MAYSSLSQLKNTLRETLVKDLEKGLKDFLSVVSEQSRLYNELMLQNARYKTLEAEKHGGRITFEEYSIGKSQVLNALLAYVTDLEAGDLKPRVIAPLQEMDWQALERQGLASEARLLVEKINRLREALALEDDPTRQMRYEKQIQQAKDRLDDIQDQSDNP